MLRRNSGGPSGSQTALFVNSFQGFPWNLSLLSLWGPSLLCRARNEMGLHAWESLQLPSGRLGVGVDVDRGSELRSAHGMLRLGHASAVVVSHSWS